MKRLSFIFCFLWNSFWLFLALLTGEVHAVAASDAFALVSQAMQTKAAGTYQGQQTITWCLPAAQGGGMMEIVTSVTHQGQRSRLTYLFPPGAAGRILTDDGAQTSLYDPQTHCLLNGPSAAREAKHDRQAMLTLLRRNYTCAVVRRERLNGRMCTVVAIRPRSQDGAYKLCWIDKQQPFVLRLEEYDRSGCRCYVSSYDTISFRPGFAHGALALPPMAQKGMVRETQPTPQTLPPSKVWTKAGFVGRLPAWLPKGYRRLRLSLLTPSGARAALIQIRCSDGLQTLTITESKVAGSMPPLAMLNSALARYGQQAWLVDSQGVRIVVRGDLSLPPDVGREFIQALSSDTELRLARAFVHHFGTALGSKVAALRRSGWDYTALVSAALFLRQHPQRSSAFFALLGKRQIWPVISYKLHADVDALDAQARTWIASAWQQP